MIDITKLLPLPLGTHPLPVEKQLVRGGNGRRRNPQPPSVACRDRILIATLIKEI
jgi:hypothetical protein